MNEKKLSKKPKLLVIHPALAPYRVDFFNEMSKMCELKLVLLNSNNANQNFDQNELLLRLNIIPSYINRNIRIMNRDIPVGLCEVFNNYKPDIVVTTEFSVTTWITAFNKLARKNKYSHVIWTDDNLKLINSDLFHRRGARRLFTSLADGWIFISEEVRYHYAKVFETTQPAATVPIIHDDVSFRHQLKQSEQLAEQYVVEYNLLGKRILLFVGRLVELKGIDLLLRAYANVVSQVDNTILIIAGEGEEQARLETLVSVLGIDENVRFVGRFEGMGLAAWYRVGQVFALASHHEAFGAVVNEALLAGLPSVVSRNAGARALIVEGVNGSIISPDDTNRFSLELIKWLERSEPLSVENPIKPNLMLTKFSDAVNSFSNLVSALMLN